MKFTRVFIPCHKTLISPLYQMLVFYVFNTDVAIFHFHLKKAENMPLPTSTFLSLSPHIMLHKWLKFF